MRKTVYTTVAGDYTTLKEVKASGLAYSVGVRNVAEKPIEISEIRKKMLKQFGRVSPELKGLLK